VELNNVSAEGIVDGRQASPLLELVTKVEAGFASVTGAAAAVAAGDDAAVPADAVDGALTADVEAAAVEAAAVELGAVEAAAVELAGAFGDVVLAELSEPQPPRAAKKEAHTNPTHTLGALNWKIIVTCPVAA
jgi:hypothetical protein